jgi:hypothetical protein
VTKAPADLSAKPLQALFNLDAWANEKVYIRLSIKSPNPAIGGKVASTFGCPRFCLE